MPLYRYTTKQGVTIVIPDTGQDQYAAEVEAKSEYGGGGYFEVDFNATTNPDGTTTHHTFQERGADKGK